MSNKMKWNTKISFFIILLTLLLSNPLATHAQTAYTVSPANEVLFTAGATPIYVQPDLALAPIVTIDANLPVQVTGVTSNGWFQISLNGNYYVTGNMLTTSATAPAPAAYVTPAYTSTLEYTITSPEQISAIKEEVVSRHATTVIIHAGAYVSEVQNIFFNRSSLRTYGDLNLRAISGTKKADGTLSLNLTYYSTLEEEVYIEAFVRKALPLFDKGTTYDKIKHIHDFICSTVTYSHDTANQLADYRSAYDALANHTAVCTGYTLLFQMFMDQLQIPCYAAVGGNHCWNIVQLDGAWYHIDVTNADQPSGIQRYNFLKGGTPSKPTWEHITLSPTDYPYR